MEKVWKKRFGKFVEKDNGKICWKIRQTNCVKNKVDKLCKTFGGQIGQKNLIRKLVDKLGEKICGKIVWNNWVEKLVGNLGGKIGWKAM